MIKVRQRLNLTNCFYHKNKKIFSRRCIMRKKYREPMMQFFILPCIGVLATSARDFTQQDINLDEIFQS